MKIVFLAGSFRGDGSAVAKEARVEVAKEQAVALAKAGIPFYSPHLNLSQLLIDHGSEFEKHAIGVQNEFLNRCDILAVLPGWEESSGTKDEIAFATEKGMPIVYLEAADAMEQLQSLVQ
jgi:hypothetical protein